tara:strand:- start:291 stop:479 length:189 start_codon:yes stop_codon:yes gene_type:complete
MRPTTVTQVVVKAVVLAVLAAGTTMVLVSSVLQTADQAAVADVFSPVWAVRHQQAVMTTKAA